MGEITGGMKGRWQNKINITLIRVIAAANEKENAGEYLTASSAVGLPEIKQALSRGYLRIAGVIPPKKEVSACPKPVQQYKLTAMGKSLAGAIEKARNENPIDGDDFKRRVNAHASALL